ncbi:uncharacterized protein N7511_009304 [Penicillium nucicola]|uniref:uncharacterized protein n=1 Tax=Penicillium nucicola TaxID=1850975 RepID=UPI002545A8CB|nr:uncharacterized protein N7511_009304 [Penicillium nucicola]KAJ5747608.1 hypothetical protein N7511_009304 [Penicillium nucicola]
MRKRASCIPELNGQPTCQERALYPIFNPQDPRHNPQAQPFSLHRQRSLNSSEPRKRKQWTQSIPRKSFHRVRSRLLALRAGLLRHSTVEDDKVGDAAKKERFVSPAALRREREQHSLRPTVYSMDTQDDLVFGTEIYRTGIPWPTLEVHEMEVSRTDDASDSDSVSGLQAAPSATSPSASPIIRVHRSPDLMFIVESSLTEPTESPSTSSNLVDDEPPGTMTQSTRAMPGHLELQLDDRAADDCILLHDLTASPWDGAISINQELDVSVHGVDDAQSSWEEHLVQGSEIQIDPVSGVSDDLAIQQEMLGNRESESRQSSISSKSTAPSIFRHLSTHRRRSGDHVRHYPSRVTEEGLANTATNLASIPISRQCSAEVEIAFPGIYQEMLEQWLREPRESQVTLPTEEDICTSQVQICSDSAQCTVTRDNAHGDLPSYEVHDQDTLILESPQTSSVIVDVSDMEELQPLNHSTPSFANDLDRQHFDNGSQEFAHSSNTIDEVMLHGIPPANSRDSGNRYSFGLHMSLSTDMEGHSVTQSNRTSYRALSFDHRNRDSQYWASNVEPGHCMFQSLQDDHAYPRLYADDSTSPERTSAEMTSMTSMSSNPWSPIDSEVLFPTSTLGANEYYLVDGKTNTHYYDGGNQPLRNSCKETREDSAHSCSSSNWTSPIRNREMTEVMFPSNMSLQFASHSACGTDEQVESEMYDIEYRGLPSHAHW